MVYRIQRWLPFVLTLCLLGTGGYYVKTRFLDPPPQASPDPAYSDEGILGGSSGLAPIPNDPGNAHPSPHPQPTFTVPDPPNFALEDYANARARHEALLRIDAIPHLDAAQKAKLVTAANRARGLGCIFVVPFDPGKTTLNPGETDLLVSGFKSSGIQRLLKDRSLVFAVLGYADPPGDAAANEKAATERAQNVQAALRGRCGIQNTTYAVGLAGASPFKPGVPAGNRLVEIWAVYP